MPVASFTDAWIETSVLEYNSNNATLMSHPLRGQLFIIFFARRLQD